MSPRSRGFTLLEVLMAIAIFALIGMATYQLLHSVLRSDDATRRHEQQLRELIRAVTLFEQDIAQVGHRTVRDHLGETQPALQAFAEPAVLSFTRTGWANPQQLPRSTWQRVRWHLNGSTLERHYWLVLDQAQDSQPRIQPVLEQVNALALRYLDTDGQWHAQWPIADKSQVLPQALELSLNVERYGKLTRVLTLVDNPALMTQGARL